MEFIEDTVAERKLIESCIGKNGSSPEHNYHHYQNLEETGAKNVFLSFGSGKGILAQHFKGVNEWMMIGDVIAPEQERITLLFEAVDSCLKNRGKFVVEAPEQLRKEIIAYAGGKSSKSAYAIGKPRFALYWPVFDFSKWNGEKLEGGEWKKLRNIKNQLYRNGNVETVDSATVPAERLRQLVKEWTRQRGQHGQYSYRRSNNKTFHERYLRLIENGFAGTRLAKSILINGEPASITAGWDIPNSDHSYYSAIGIYDYRHEGLGEVANIEDLALIKGTGYKYADFGGSPKPLLNFKLKFRPTSVYKTYTFAVMRK
ncbi:hypothetical protein HYV82_00285 [Candidatus Woesearchaeota archaeon]|nr:hypothetical protein [Candidatus Woesearchaeota archaeon]